MSCSIKFLLIQPLMSFLSNILIYFHARVTSLKHVCSIWNFSVMRWCRVGDRSIENFFPHYIHECNVVVAVIWRVICLYCESVSALHMRMIYCPLQRGTKEISRVSKGLYVSVVGHTRISSEEEDGMRLKILNFIMQILLLLLISTCKCRSLNIHTISIWLRAKKLPQDIPQTCYFYTIWFTI